MHAHTRAAGRSADQPSSEGGSMPSTVQLDACGRRRSPGTLSSFHQGRAPRNKGQRYPADPPTVEEIIAVARTGVALPLGRPRDAAQTETHEPAGD